MTFSSMIQDRERLAEKMREADEAMEAALEKLEAANRYCLEVDRVLEAKSREYNHQGPTYRH